MAPAKWPVRDRHNTPPKRVLSSKFSYHMAKPLLPYGTKFMSDELRFFARHVPSGRILWHSRTAQKFCSVSFEDPDDLKTRLAGRNTMTRLGDLLRAPRPCFPHTLRVNSCDLGLTPTTPVSAMWLVGLSEYRATIRKRLTEALFRTREYAASIAFVTCKERHLFRCLSLRLESCFEIPSFFNRAIPFQRCCISGSSDRRHSTGHWTNRLGCFCRLLS